MKRFIATSCAAFLLAACTSNTLSFELQFDTADKQQIAELSLAATRVIERRLVRLKAEALDIDFQRKDNTTILTAKVSDREAAKALSKELTSPFSVEIMRATEELQDGDLIVEGHGNFRSVGITAEDFHWLSAQEDGAFEGKGAVIVRFTDEGAEKVRTLFRENKGKFIGLFVRQQLAAKIQIQDEIVENIIVISQLPSVELANVFVDDVNVGRYVRFVAL